MKSKIEQLRAAYDQIQSVNPDSPTYERLCKFLDKQNSQTLQVLVDAKIKWVSPLARNRLIRR